MAESCSNAKWWDFREKKDKNKKVGNTFQEHKTLQVTTFDLVPKPRLKSLTSESDTSQWVGVCQAVGSLKNTAQHGCKDPQRVPKPVALKDLTSNIKQEQLIHD